MYQEGELVMYESTGVCRVEAVGDAPESSAPPGRPYYRLSPLYRSGVIYVPVEGKAFLRPVLSRSEAMELIHRIPDIRDDAFQDCERRQLENCYRQTLRSHSCESLVELIKALYTKARAMDRAGKRLGRVDEEYRKRAEELLHGELAAALDLPLDSVPEFIAGQVSMKKTT